VKEFFITATGKFQGGGCFGHVHSVLLQPSILQLHRLTADGLSKILMENTFLLASNLSQMNGWPARQFLFVNVFIVESVSPHR